MQNNRLNQLQCDFLSCFFEREQRFFLTGGAALVGFYLFHRETYDLDLFTLANAVDEGAAAVLETARILNASAEAIQTAPDFRRFLIRRENESIVVDLVRETVVQSSSEKPIINGIRVDPPEEILANKLCALLSRSEVRDLVDARALETAGYRIEDALPVAALKDTGLTVAQLGWVLSQIVLGDDLIPPGSVSVAELRGYLSDLINRLARLAFPSSANKNN